jgi:transglutaminase-like putative cysteine protease
MEIELYTKASEFIDSDNKNIKEQAKILSTGVDHDYEIAKNCFIYVRDEIRHSLDYKLNPVTCMASEVLKYKTGYCYAKSHLLAALLRANNIPAGLCYQRLSIEGKGAPFCLHGLNAIYLKKHGWYRVDAIGNGNSINANFNPPHEELAFELDDKLEADFQEIWPEPLKIVTDVLTSSKTFLEVSNALPDIQVLKGK